MFMWSCRPLSVKVCKEPHSQHFVSLFGPCFQVGVIAVAFIWRLPKIRGLKIILIKAPNRRAPAMGTLTRRTPIYRKEPCPTPPRTDPDQRTGASEACSGSVAEGLDFGYLIIRDLRPNINIRRIYMYIYICIYIYVYMYIYICIYVYIYRVFKA